MLKIKDDVNLKELGFDKDGFDYVYMDDYGLCTKDDRIIWFGNMGGFMENQNIHLDRLYDLIKADLVEKVEE